MCFGVTAEPTRISTPPTILPRPSRSPIVPLDPRSLSPSHPHPCPRTCMHSLSTPARPDPKGLRWECIHNWHRHGTVLATRL